MWRRVSFFILFRLSTNWMRPTQIREGNLLYSVYQFKFHSGIKKMGHIIIMECCCCCLIASVVTNSVRPYGLQPSRLLCPWDSLGKSTRVSCHDLLQGIFPTQGSNPGLLHCRQSLYRGISREAQQNAAAAAAAKSLQSCQTLCDPMDSSPPGSSVHGILQSRILEWVAISLSKWNATQP